MTEQASACSVKVATALMLLSTLALQCLPVALLSAPAQVGLNLSLGQAP